MRLSKHIALSGYLVAALFVFMTMVDTALSVFPFRVHDASWRFGAVGIASRALLSPLFGFFLAYCLALALEQRRAQRAIAAATGVAALGVVALLGLFALDALQLRSRVNPVGRAAFDFAVAGSTVKFLVSFVVLVSIASAAWLTSGERVGVARQKQKAPSSLLVARGTSAHASGGALSR